MAKENLIAVADKNDKLIGKATKAKAIEKKLWRRIAKTIIFNSKGELLIQKRSKKVYGPSLLDISSAGHVDFGETYLQAAKREMFEEIGINVPIKKIIKYNLDTTLLHYCIFAGYFEGPFKKNKEVAWLKFFSLNDILKMIENNPSQFTPGCLFMFNNYKPILKKFSEYSKKKFNHNCR